MADSPVQSPSPSPEAAGDNSLDSLFATIDKHASVNPTFKGVGDAQRGGLVDRVSAYTSAVEAGVSAGAVNALDFVTAGAFNLDGRDAANNYDLSQGFHIGPVNTAELVKGFAQVGTGLMLTAPIGSGLGAVGNTIRGVGAASRIRWVNQVGQLVSAAGRSTAVKLAVSDFASFDEHEAKLSNLLVQANSPILNNAVTQYLASNESDGFWEGRFKNMVEGGIIGKAMDGLFGGLKKLRAMRKGAGAEAGADVAQIASGVQTTFPHADFTDFSPVSKTVDGNLVFTALDTQTGKHTEFSLKSEDFGGMSAEDINAILHPAPAAPHVPAAVTEDALNGWFKQWDEATAVKPSKGSAAAHVLDPASEMAILRMAEHGQQAVEGFSSISPVHAEIGRAVDEAVGRGLGGGGIGQGEGDLIKFILSLYSLPMKGKQVSVEILGKINQRATRVLRDIGLGDRVLGASLDGGGVVKVLPEAVKTLRVAHTLLHEVTHAVLDSGSAALKTEALDAVRSVMKSADPFEVARTVHNLSSHEITAMKEALARAKASGAVDSLEHLQTLVNKDADLKALSVAPSDKSALLDAAYFTHPEEIFAEYAAQAMVKTAKKVNPSAVVNALTKGGVIDVAVRKLLDNVKRVFGRTDSTIQQSVINLMEGRVDRHVDAVLGRRSTDAATQLAEEAIRPSPLGRAVRIAAKFKREVAGQSTPAPVHLDEFVSAIQAIKLGDRARVDFILENSSWINGPVMGLDAGQQQVVAGLAKVIEREYNNVFKRTTFDEIGNAARKMVDNDAEALGLADRTITSMRDAAAGSVAVSSMFRADTRGMTKMVTAYVKAGDEAIKAELAKQITESLPAYVVSLMNTAGIGRLAGQTLAARKIILDGIRGTLERGKGTVAAAGEAVDNAVAPVAAQATEKLSIEQAKQLATGGIENPTPGRISPAVQTAINDLPVEARVLVGKVQQFVDGGLKNPKEFMDDLSKAFGIIEKSPNRIPDMIAAMSPEKPTLFKMFLEAWMGSVLSGTRTLSSNVITNAVQAIAAPGLQILGGNAKAGFQLYSSMAGVLSDAIHGLDAVNEMGPLFKTVKDSFTREHPILDAAGTSLDINAHQIRGSVGRFVRLPMRVLGATDEFFKQLNYRAYLYHQNSGEAWAKVARGDLPQANVGAYIREKVSRGFNEGGHAALTEDGVPLFQEAFQWARDNTFTRGLNEDGSIIRKFGNQLQKMKADIPAIALVLPFVKTPTNVIEKGVYMTPGFNLLFKDYRSRFMSADAGIRAQARGEMVVGSSIAGLFTLMATSDMLTGAGPSDPAQLARLRESGWRPYSVKISDGNGGFTYFEYKKLDPFAVPIGMVADGVEAWNAAHRANDSEAKAIAESVINGIALGFSKNVVNRSYMQGVKNTLDLMSQPSAAEAEKYFRNYFSSFVPAIVGNMPVVHGEYEAEARGVLDGVRARIPGLSSYLPPKRNVIGEPIVAPNVTRLSPFAVSAQKADAVAMEMSRLQFGFDNPPKKWNNVDLVAFQTKSGQDAYDRWEQLQGEVKIGGKTLRETLAHTIDSAAYQKLALPTGTADNQNPRIRAVASIIGAYRKLALGHMLKEVPAVMDEAKRLNSQATGRPIPPRSADQMAGPRQNPLSLLQ